MPISGRSKLGDIAQLSYSHHQPSASARANLRSCELYPGRDRLQRMQVGRQPVTGQTCSPNPIQLTSKCLASCAPSDARDFQNGALQAILRRS